VLNENTKLPGK